MGSDVLRACVARRVWLEGWGSHAGGGVSGARVGRLRRNGGVVGVTAQHKFDGRLCVALALRST